MPTSDRKLGETASQPSKPGTVETGTRPPNSCSRKVQDELFRRAWYHATDDNHLTLFGFRRFRTAHLINLRFLEAEIDQLDHQIFQAGLNLGIKPGEADRLGLRQARRDPNLKPGSNLSASLASKLRRLLREYDEALVSLHNLMRMETFAMADNEWQSGLRQDLNPYEVYKTRLVRPDLDYRGGTRDPLRHGLRKCLRGIWFFAHSRKGAHSHRDKSDPSPSELEANVRRSYQNTGRLADTIARFLIAIMTAAFLIAPLGFLTKETSIGAHLVTVSIFILAFAVFLAICSRATNQEIMGASAAYAAVLVVFVSSRSVS